MFEDDLDIDEILDGYESTSLKRTNSDIHIEPSCKKPKISPSSIEENAIDNSRPSTTVKKMFRFKKKETFQDTTSKIAVESSVNNEVSSPSRQHSYESKENEVEMIPKNVSTSRSFEENERSMLGKEHRNESVNKFTEGLEGCLKFSDQSTSSRNINVNAGNSANSIFQNDRTFIKRRFPGPAGLLPERNSNNSFTESMNESSNIQTKNEVCSQSSLILFNEEPWEKMMSDFATAEVTLPEKYNIQWIKSRAVTKKLINQKAPFLAAFIDSIRSHSIQNPIVNLVLKDKTGTIQGTILHNLYEEHSGDLTVGSVIVLRDLGVLNTGQNDEPYLTITRNNLVSIYSNGKRIGDDSTQTSGKISKIILQNLDATEILNRIRENKRLHEIETTNTRNISFIRRDIKGPTNFRETFKKAVSNVKSSTDSEPPNLGVLRVNSLKLTESAKEGPSCSKKENENIEDIMGFFNTQEGIEEFFNDEPNFCSTQKGSPDKRSNKPLKPKPETGSVSIQDNDKIFEDMFEGVDTNALFEDF